MLCPYIRSSSANQYDFCEMRYTFEYLFGFKSASGKKAVQGTVFHKVQELRAQASKAIRAKKKVFEDDNFGIVKVSDATNLMGSLDRCWDYYINKNKELEFKSLDKDQVAKWLIDTHDNWPQYDPLNLNVIATEQYFDIPIKKEWAKYSGTIKGKEYSGHLHIKGTMDMVVELSEGVYELVDYKSGAYRSDFATGKEKTLEYLQNDTQLLLYLIALKNKWPDKHWIMSLFFIRVGGLFSVVGDDAMLARAWKMLEDKFTSISQCESPSQFDPTNKDWRCRNLCPFAKQDSYTRGLSICQHFKNKIDRKGLQAVQDEFVDEKRLFNYQDGGGRSNDD